MTKKMTKIAFMTGALLLFNHPLSCLTLPDDDRASPSPTHVTLEAQLQEAENEIAAQLANLSPEQRENYDALQAEPRLIELSEELDTLRDEMTNGTDADGVEIDLAAHLIRHKLLQCQLFEFVAQWREARLGAEG